MTTLRVCVIAHLRFPIRQPFAGGLEAATYALVQRLVAHGHEVTVLAAPGSFPDLPVRVVSPSHHESGALSGGQFTSVDEARSHRAYLELMLELGRGDDHYDVIHNHSLHYLPLALAGGLAAPMVSTFHTPPFPTLEAAVRLAPVTTTFTSVSDFTAAMWEDTTPSTVVPNGVDLARFRWGAGGGSPVWSGRLVPEKAPHEAMDAARLAGLPLRIAGPVSDTRYYRREIEPRLGGGLTYVGHLDHSRLSRLVASASVCVITPAWEEPFGLVAAEAAACGTPVAAYARGALRHLVNQHTGVLAPPGDVTGLAEAMRSATRIDRRGVRIHAEKCLSLDATVNQYVDLYRRLCFPHDTAA